jgi:small-conductance mechanosensitive channel
MTLENFIVIAIGVVSIICGALVVRNRSKLFDVFADANRALGGPPGREVARRSSPFWVGFVGAGIVVIGAVAILAGIFARE